MPWILQMTGCAVSLLFIAFMLWVGFWFVLGVFAIATLIIGWGQIRDYLIEKGILNPVPGVPSDSIIIEEESTIIEGDYKRVDDKAKDEH